MHEYIKTGNATQSAINAGYSQKTAKTIGAENLTKPDLKKYIDSKLKDISNNAIATAEETLTILTKIVRGEHTEQVITAEVLTIFALMTTAANLQNLSVLTKIVRNY